MRHYEKSDGNPKAVFFENDMNKTRAARTREGGGRNNGTASSPPAHSPHQPTRPSTSSLPSLPARPHWVPILAPSIVLAASQLSLRTYMHRYNFLRLYAQI